MTHTQKSELYQYPCFLLMTGPWTVFNPPCGSQKTTAQGQARPHVLCWVPQQKPVHESQASQAPRSTVALFTEWHRLSGTTLCWSPRICGSRQSFSHPLPQGWRLDNYVAALSLLIRRVTFLTDSFENSLLKLFLEQKTDYSSDMLYLLWHETLFLFLLLGDV